MNLPTNQVTPPPVESVEEAFCPPDQDLLRIRRNLPSLLDELRGHLKNGGDGFPVLKHGQPHKVVRLTPEEAGRPEQWFFIGDLHGDFFALHTLLKYAQTACPDCRILFLGDMVDRGDLPVECTLLMLEWGLRHPGRLAWIAGNHDVAFSVNEAGAFHSQVSPAEFLQVLNLQDTLISFRQTLGQFFIEMASGLPRALLFPDGLLATHGGFPLVDLHGAGTAITQEQDYLDWLNSDACLKDFTWTRIHRNPKKFPDRYSTGSQYGFKDFEAFCALKPDWFGVKRMITGHEHPKAGFLVHETYKINPALTLTGFGFDDFKAMPGAYADYTSELHLARGSTDALPEVIAVPVNRGELEMMYPGTLGNAPAANSVTAEQESTVPPIDRIAPSATPPAEIPPVG